MISPTRGRWAVGLSWFLLTNLLVIRYFRPIFSILAIFSFRLWIDWLLLLFAFFSGRGYRLLGVSGIVVVLLSGLVLAGNLLEHGFTIAGIIESVNILLVLSVPMFYGALFLRLPPAVTLRHRLSVRRILNAYFFANVGFIIGQATGMLPIATAFLAENTFFQDHLTGLIGLNGVSTLNFLWVATIASNIYVGAVHAQRGGFALALVQLAIVIALSPVNDNKMVLLTISSAALVLLAAYAQWLRGWLIVFAAAAALAIPFAIDAVVSTFTSASGASLDLLRVIFYDSAAQPNPNNERAFINDLAFRYYDASSTGIGLANANDTTESIHIHLGINSASLILIQGGWPLLIAATGLLFIALRAIVARASFALQGALALMSIVVMYASNPIADRYSLIAICLILWYLPQTNEASAGDMGLQSRYLGTSDPSPRRRAIPYPS